MSTVHVLSNYLQEIENGHSFLGLACFICMLTSVRAIIEGGKGPEYCVQKLPFCGVLTGPPKSWWPKQGCTNRTFNFFSKNANCRENNGNIVNLKNAIDFTDSVYFNLEEMIDQNPNKQNLFKEMYQKASILALFAE